MDLTQELTNSSRLLADMLTDVIIDAPEHVEQAIELTEVGVGPMPMRISRVVYLINLKEPALLLPYWSVLFRITTSTQNESVRRNFLNLFLQGLENLNNEQCMELLDKCLDWMLSVKEKTAVRGLSVKVVVLLAKRYPELQGEIALTIEELTLTADASLLAMAHTGLAKVEKLVTKSNW